MKKNQLKVGLVIARPNKGTKELERFVLKNSIQVFLFPEGFLHPDDLKDACEIAKKHGKWIITGMDDRREPKEKFETAIIIDPSGNIVGEHKKTSLTKYEINKGYSRGDSIQVVKTDICSIGLSICYEIYFPEISRLYALQGAKIILNPIGTGMWNEQQFKLWSSVAQTRACENGVYVLGCSHYNDSIPIAFAYDPNGNCLVLSRDVNRVIPVTIDLSSGEEDKFKQRRPELYGEIVNNN